MTFRMIITSEDKKSDIGVRNANAERELINSA